MQTLTSQTFPSNMPEPAGEPAFMARIHAGPESLSGAAVNDNMAGWTPTLLVQRRRRLKRRSNRV